MLLSELQHTKSLMGSMEAEMRAQKRELERTKKATKALNKKFASADDESAKLPQLQVRVCPCTGQRARTHSLATPRQPARLSVCMLRAPHL